MTQKLLEGFREFYSIEYGGKDATMPRLVKDGQAPEYFIISCIDSRSNPGTIFHSPPGTFFGFQAMGAIVPPYKKGTALAAALQFALTAMKVKNVIGVGHTQCGAVKALADNIQDEEISGFLDVTQHCLHRAKDIVGSPVEEEELLRATEEQIVLESMRNLTGYPSVSLALSEKRLNIMGWIFDMGHGKLLEHNPETQRFTPIANIEP